MGKLNSQHVGILHESNHDEVERHFRPMVADARHLPGRSIGLLFLLGWLLISIASSAPTTAPAPAPAPAPASTPAPLPSKPATTEKEKAPASPLKAGDSASIIPSRFVGEDDLTGYIEARTSMFAMQGRANDPFGQLQDPNAKPVLKTTVAKATRRIAPILATPFSEIIKLLKVTTIMPKEQRFLLGTRSIKQGDCVSLSFRGKNIRVQVSSVNSRQIEFLNLENNEAASLKLNILPPGMTAGTGGITTLGKISNRQDSPIELDPGNLPNEKSPKTP